ncbi:MAG TPA: hypothetical protein VFN57_04570 [Thermomicrobiaceae bacterium]|nr:hypothetical protein [Thermomicrobiaceae bacterium]
MQPERDGATGTSGDAAVEPGTDGPNVSEPPAAADPAKAEASRRSAARLILATAGCMVVVVAGVFLQFLPLVIVGFALSVVAVVVL